jgi:hypothetical protein
MDALPRRTDASGVTVLVSARLETRGVLAAFTERTGGHSGPPFDSLNLGFKEGDDPGAVRANRDAVCSALDVPSFATAEQVHGRELARIGPGQRGAGYTVPAASAAGCDALEAAAAGVSLAILTADCVPIALGDDRRIVAVHAGWRGLAEGVLARALERFPVTSEVSAAIGPAIGPCHYEVGDDVRRAVGWPERRTIRRAGRWYLDLPGVAADWLREGGVTDIEEGAPCTACEEDRFYSYRRDGRTGRQALVMVRR